MTPGDWVQTISAAIGILGTLMWLWKKKIAPVHRQVKKIFAEAFSNGGSSIKDTVARIDKTVAEICDHLSASAHRMRTLLQADRKPVFETDATGHFIWINDAYVEMCGRMPYDIYQTGWLTHVAQDERANVSEEWAACVSQVRDFDDEYTICNYKKNESYRVRVRATVLRGLNDKVMGYLGTVEILRRLSPSPTPASGSHESTHSN